MAGPAGVNPTAAGTATAGSTGTFDNPNGTSGQSGANLNGGQGGNGASGSSFTEFVNGDFAIGLEGWTAVNVRVVLGPTPTATPPGTNTIAGWPTPTDPTPAPDGGTESPAVSGSYSTVVQNGRAVMNSSLSVANNIENFTGSIDDGTPGNPGNILTVSDVPSGPIVVGQYVSGSGVSQRQITGQISGTPGGAGTYSLGGAPQSVASTSMRANSGGVAHGPALVSDQPVTIGAGAQVSFNWEASGGSDAFDVFAYLLNVDTGETVTLLDATGANASTIQPPTTVVIPVATTANYKFVFVSGTWDATRGQAAGARLSITDIQILNNPVVAGPAVGGNGGDGGNGGADVGDGGGGGDGGSATSDFAGANIAGNGGAGGNAQAAGGSGGDGGDGGELISADGGAAGNGGTGGNGADGSASLAAGAGGRGGDGGDGGSVSGVGGAGGQGGNGGNGGIGAQGGGGGAGGAAGVAIDQGTDGTAGNGGNAGDGAIGGAGGQGGAGGNGGTGISGDGQGGQGGQGGNGGTGGTGGDGGNAGDGTAGEAGGAGNAGTAGNAGGVASGTAGGTGGSAGEGGTGGVGGAGAQI
ncbi:hypothetical protein NGTWS0302_00270 [Mycolicibacterium cyprinidarum]|uniref:PE-PGRS family protein n=1 Tax=Mycolicibacterium cyprinidarum TaxID=2860311 RepID=A0ABQ4VAZ0_9MYCO|nr:hypothetical protein NGTWS0302_00270 [Mycolicibacterium sp. NGTWS0302]GJF16165.1 hypothetical protein NGTWS1702_20640 [Mycolicibacterium sp. NGTWSNA01]